MTNNMTMTYKKIMRADEGDLNPQQMSIRNSTCARCGGTGIDVDMKDRLICDNIDGHECWSHASCAGYR